MLAVDVATGDPSRPWIKQIRSLAIILHEEFGVPFQFYDAATGCRLEGIATGEDNTSGTALPPAPMFATSRAAQLTVEGVAQVQFLRPGQYELALPFVAARQPATIAVGVVSGLARSAAEVILEQARLGKWAHSVHLRLCAANQAVEPSRHRHASDHAGANLVGLEALMSLEQLLRTQKIEKTPEKNRSQILQAAARVLHAQTVLWVPAEGAEAVIEGEPLLSLWDCGQLARLLAQDPEAGRAGYLRINHVPAASWGARFPPLATLLAVPVAPRSAQSWVIALNKSASPTQRPSGSSAMKSGSSAAGDATFRRTDAALLLPFAALLGVHLRAVRQHVQLKELLEHPVCRDAGAPALPSGCPPSAAALPD
jgi:hypothetical protein